MERIRVGIAGTGYTVGIAGMHVNGYASVSDKCEVVALYDVIPGRAAQWAKEKNLHVTICDSFEELLGRVDLVSLCVPNDQHIPLLLKAFEAHKHVLCEKPISVDAQTARAAVEAEPDDRIHMVGFCYRGIPALRYMKQIMDSGRMGRVFTYRETLGGCRIANHDVKLEWRMQKKTSGTGALADFGCHMIDLCDWLLHDTQGPIEQVNGMYTRSVMQRASIETGEMSDVTNDDSASFTLRLHSGALASFVASRLGVARHTLESYGEGGMMLFRDDKPNEVELWLKEQGGAYDSANRQIVQVPEELVTIPWKNEEFAVLMDCIRTGRKPERSLQRGLYIQTIVDAAEKACQSGETITIPQ
ncbi:MAG: Gfo/Idh/MocA family protein [Aristaeellaceae bacterium]